MTNEEYLTVTRSEDIDGFVCRSDGWGISAESANEEDAVNFVKGALLCALGTRMQVIPNDVTIRFHVQRRLEGKSDPILCDIVDCSSHPTYECVCRRCANEPTRKERYHSCKTHQLEVGSMHMRVRERPADWKAL